MTPADPGKPLERRTRLDSAIFIAVAVIISALIAGAAVTGAQDIDGTDSQTGPTSSSSTCAP